MRLFKVPNATIVWNFSAIDCFLTFELSPPGGKINFENEPTWTLESPANEDRRQGDEKGGRLRTDTKSISYRGVEYTRDQPPIWAWSQVGSQSAGTACTRSIPTQPGETIQCGGTISAADPGSA